MAGKKAKKNKVVGGKVVKNVAPIVDKTTLGDIIKDADQAVVVTSTKGRIEITGIKNINYTYEAKGLLVGAMDIYNIRPIITGLNSNTRALLSHITNLSNKIDKVLPIEELKVK